MNYLPRILRWFLPACFVFSTSLAWASLAQEGAAGVQDLVDEGAKLEADLRELNVAAAMVGRTSMWPAPEPEQTPEEWREAVLKAPFTSVSALLKQVPGVSVQIARTETLSPILKGSRGWYSAVVHPLQDAGFHVDMNSDVELRVLARLGGGQVTTSRGGKKVGDYNAYSLRLDFALVLPARILRGDKIFHSELSLATITVLQARGAYPSAKELSDAIQQGVEITFKFAKADTEKTFPDAGWTLWVGQGEETQVRHAAFRAAYRKASEEMSPGLGYSGGFRGVEGDYASAATIFVMNDYAKKGALANYWKRWLPANGISCEVFPAPILKHTWILVPDKTGQMVAAASRLSVRDSDCLVHLGGQYFRVQGYSHVDNSLTKVALKGDIRSPLVQQLKDQFSKLRTIARPKGRRPAHLKHAQAPAIKRSLLKRKRVEVPDWAVDQLANRIAFEVESNSDITKADHKFWTRTVDGQPFFDLGHFGDACHAGLVPEKVQKACRRSIQRIQLGDPLGVFAFDNVFSTNPEGDYVVLAKDYLLRYEGTRPQGKGSLYVERVQSASEAARRLIRIYAKDEEAARAAIHPFQEILESHKVLTCSYHDEEDPMTKSGRGYWFWYKEAPANWQEILDAAPKGCGLHRIGPPVFLAPDYMSEAKKLLAEYRKSTGH